jgi:hypothetical protein
MQQLNLNRSQIQYILTSNLFLILAQKSMPSLLPCSCSETPKSSKFSFNIHEKLPDTYSLTCPKYYMWNTFCVTFLNVAYMTPYIKLQTASSPIICLLCFC